MARKTPTKKSQQPQPQQKEKEVTTTVNDVATEETVEEQNDVNTTTPTPTKKNKNDTSTTTTTKSTTTPKKKSASSSKKQAVNSDDVDEDDKIDVDELNDIFKQFDKASNAFKNQGQDNAEDEDASDESSKIELTDEKVPANDSDLIMTRSEKSKKYKAPQSVHFFIHLKKRFLKIQITLHNIPQKHMLLNLETDHFSIDTTSFTKKLFLERKYPGLVKIDPQNPRAELMKGDVLTVWVPIVSMPKETFDKEMAIIEARIREKSIKFPPQAKKIISIRAKQLEKKSAQKKRRREKEKFYEQGLDIKKSVSGKKQKTA